MASTTRSWLGLVPALLVVYGAVLGAAPSPAVPEARLLGPAEVAEKLKFYERIATLRTTFSQTKTMKEIGVALDSKGHLEIERPSKVRWVVEQPSPMTVVVDGSNVKLESGTGADKKTEQWDMASVTDEKLSKALVGMLAWMRLDVPTLQASYAISELPGGQLRAVPKETAAVPFKALVFRVHKDGHLESLRLEEVSGDEIAIEFGKPRIQKK